MINRKKVCVVGGVGHVGAPLGLAFGSKGYNVILIDKDNKHEMLKSRYDPFSEAKIIIEKASEDLKKNNFS